MPTRLSQEPSARPRSLPELMALAHAVEAEAITRYAQLAAEMKRRGDHDLAATFDALLEEERAHLAEVTRWSTERTGAPPPARGAWHLPPEIAASWDEVAESALLTSYRALGIAVHNEEQGFAFYSYVAARADDPAVRAAAERLAEEELHHAALLRRERRRAWRRQGLAMRRFAPRRVTSMAEFVRCTGDMESRAAAIHAQLAERLSQIGDEASAAALQIVAADEHRAACAFVGEGIMAGRPAPVEHGGAGSAADLLRHALAEAERLHEAYIDLADHATEERILAQAQSAASRAVRNIGRIVARLHVAEIRAPGGDASPAPRRPT